MSDNFRVALSSQCEELKNRLLSEYNNAQIRFQKQLTLLAEENQRLRGHLNADVQEDELLRVPILDGRDEEPQNEAAYVSIGGQSEGPGEVITIGSQWSDGVQSGSNDPGNIDCHVFENDSNTESRALSKAEREMPLPKLPQSVSRTESIRSRQETVRRSREKRASASNLEESPPAVLPSPPTSRPGSIHLGNTSFAGSRVSILEDAADVCMISGGCNANNRNSFSCVSNIVSGNVKAESTDPFKVAKIFSQKDNTCRWAGSRDGRRSKRASAGWPVFGLRRQTSIIAEWSRRKSLTSGTTANGQMGPCARCMRTFMITPYSPVHLCWELCSMLLVFYDLVFIPLQAFEIREAGAVVTMGWICRFWWITDIFVNFLTGYLDGEGLLVMIPSMVAKRYAKRQLPLDLVVVTTDCAELILGTRTAGIMKSWRLLRIVRLFRLKKARDISNRMLEYIGAERGSILVMIRICRMFLVLLIVAHLISCTWYAVGTLSRDHGMKSWITRNMQRLKLSERYMISFHWATGLFFGEQVLLPLNSMERCFTTLVLCFVFTVQIWFVSSVTTAMTHLEIVASTRSQQFAALLRFLSDNGIRADLAHKVKHNAAQALDAQQRNAPESSIELLKLISEPLMIQVHYAIYSTKLRIHPFFRCYSEVNAPGLGKICHISVSVINCCRGDLIFQDLEAPAVPQMFFVVGGELSYSREGCIQQELTSKHWIAEAVLWCSEWIYNGSMHAISDHSRLMAMNAESFQSLVSKDKLMFHQACSYAFGFAKLLNDTPVEEMTDVGTMTRDFEDLMLGTMPEEWSTVKKTYSVTRGSFASATSEFQ